MKEKKQFFVPPNYEKKFEFIPKISGWQHIAFVPVIGIDFYILANAPFSSFSNNLVAVLTTWAVPWVLIATKPVRNNVSLYQHLVWKLKFLKRQRTFKYRKEGYDHAIQQEIEREIRSKAAKAAADRKADNSGFDTNKKNRGWSFNHSRQQNDPDTKGKCIESGANK